MEKKVFVLGVDGAELDLILQWVKVEKLPQDLSIGRPSIRCNICCLQ
ncbi:MAG: hypothetical protein HXS40_09385 [Theionarchaea archaeon]|nr:hypothetical protein [Theionarchaea archaeon]